MTFSARARNQGITRTGFTGTQAKTGTSKLQNNGCFLKDRRSRVKTSLQRQGADGSQRHLENDDQRKARAKGFLACLVPEEMARRHRSRAATEKGDRQQRPLADPPFAGPRRLLVVPEQPEGSQVDENCERERGKGDGHGRSLADRR